MKVILTTMVIVAFTAANAYSKPGGWIQDMLDRSSISIRSSGCSPTYYNAPVPVYYSQSQVYYQSLPVVSHGHAVYVCPPLMHYRQPGYGRSQMIYQGTGRW